MKNKLIIFALLVILAGCKKTEYKLVQEVVKCKMFQQYQYRTYSIIGTQKRYGTWYNTSDPIAYSDKCEDENKVLGFTIIEIDKYRGREERWLIVKGK
jgi:hypothetical protein